MAVSLTAVRRTSHLKTKYLKLFTSKEFCTQVIKTEYFFEIFPPRFPGDPITHLGQADLFAHTFEGRNFVFFKTAPYQN